MRNVFETQCKIGNVEVAEIEIEIDSRDEIPKVMLGLREIYCSTSLRKKISKILEGLTPEGVSTKKGRKGMSYWQVLCLGTLRLICNWDYDKLREIANNHITFRQMLGLSPIIDWDFKFGLQTLRDNLAQFTPEILSEVNQAVVLYGQKYIGKEGVKISARCDSSVVKTNVHFPTDINLLFDAIRKVITLIERASSAAGYSAWRQSSHNLRQVKKRFRKAQKLKHSTSKDDAKKEARVQLIQESYQDYLDIVEKFMDRSEQTVGRLQGQSIVIDAILQEVEYFRSHAIRQIDQIRRRIIGDEKIPHKEKLFSCFEEHTEWISKGKAGVPQELGHRVSIIEDQWGFILNHQVMTKETDDKIAVSFIQETKNLFPALNGCSFDKGYYSPSNREDLKKDLNSVVMPKKGKLSKKDKEVEYSADFVKKRKQHSAIESAIHSLQNHGMDRCPDKGQAGFERYVALAILARNIEKLGDKIQKSQKKQKKRKEKYNKTYQENRRIVA